jgi:prepilin-type N-terminal cleavage/methylation domain-containing protein
MSARSRLRHGVTLIEFLFGIAIVTSVFALSYFALQGLGTRELPAQGAPQLSASPSGR